MKVGISVKGTHLAVTIGSLKAPEVSSAEEHWLFSLVIMLPF